MMIPAHPGRSPRFFLVVLAAFLACGGLNGCRSGSFHLQLFNACSDTIVVRERDQDQHPVVVYASLSGDVTGISTDGFTIERNGKVLRYHFPQGYLFPSAAVPSGYVRRVRHLGRAYVFQFDADNRIYILSTKEPLVQRQHPTQPAGFPLVPYQVETPAAVKPDKTPRPVGLDGL